jgi:antigen flippase
VSDALLDPPPEAKRRGRFRELLLSPALRQRVLAPMGFDASILLTNLITGIVIARALGPAGRGEITAILLLAQMAVWFFSGGATEAIAYRLSKHPGEAARLLGTWLALGVPLGVLGIAAAELALPILFSAQTEATIDLGRIYIPIVVVMLLQTVLYGTLLGSHDFLFYNLSRLALPVLIAVPYLALWVAGELSVELALIVNAVATVGAFALAAVRSLTRHGVGAPSLPLLRETLWYGLRAHVGSIAGLVSARLDLLIVPAFLGAASVGLYSVATNVTSIIVTLTATIARLVLPVASRAEQSARTVIRTMHAVFLIGIAIAVPLGILAPLALKVVYGADFESAATALRILLPGVVVDAAAMVLWSGLLAANRPFLSSLAAAPAAVLTIVGLILFLESGGIDAAAIVSTCAYTTLFAISVVLYRNVAGLRWRDFVVAPAR